MRRIALGLLLALTAVPAALAADRTDRIPASVGPDDYRSYYVNPSANLPGEITADRWQAVAKRVMERWGATYLGTTSASPANHEDGLNVIGFTTTLPSGVAGRNSKSKGGMRRGGSTSGQCSPVGDMAFTESFVPVTETKRLRVRADVVRRGKVRKRTKTVSRTIKGGRIDRAGVSGRRCVEVARDAESDPSSVQHESDVEMDTTPGAPWEPGPDLPGGGELDLETVLLHEIGHAAGLSHQPQNCDPSTPMRPSGGGGEYWRGVDEVFYDAPCSAPFPVTPDPPAGAEGPFGFASLGGHTFHVNPAVPAGYDGARFVALVQSIVERWGGTFGGTAAEAPTVGDGRSVIGFDVIAGVGYELTRHTTTERLEHPAHRDCATGAGTIQSFKVKRVTKRVRVRVRGRRRTLKLRRDRVVGVKTPAQVPTGTCADVPARAEERPPVVEMDVGIAHEMDAYEMGPRHPVQTTRMDMATMLADAIGRLAGAAPGDRCAGSTPVADGLQAGDWWRSPSDRQRLNCAGGRAAIAAAGPGRVRYVRVQE